MVGPSREFRAWLDQYQRHALAPMHLDDDDLAAAFEAGRAAGPTATYDPPPGPWTPADCWNPKEHPGCYCKRHDKGGPHGFTHRSEIDPDWPPKITDPEELERMRKRMRYLGTVRQVTDPIEAVRDHPPVAWWRSRLQPGEFVVFCQMPADCREIDWTYFVEKGWINRIGPEGDLQNILGHPTKVERAPVVEGRKAGWWIRVVPFEDASGEPLRAACVKHEADGYVPSVSVGGMVVQRTLGPPPEIVVLRAVNATWDDGFGAVLGPALEELS